MIRCAAHPNKRRCMSPAIWGKAARADSWPQWPIHRPGSSRPKALRVFARNMRSCSRGASQAGRGRSPGPRRIGDRSENGDYIYGTKRLRELDRRLSHLARIMKAAKVVDPAKQAHVTRCGSARRSNSRTRTKSARLLTIVGDDETDAGAGRIGWSAPIARALIGAKMGDERIVRLPPARKATK